MNELPQDPTKEELLFLAHTLVVLSNSLVTLALTLRDAKCEMPSPERDAAHLEVDQLLDRLMKSSG
jgi:hypothetical protein